MSRQPESYYLQCAIEDDIDYYKSKGLSAEETMRKVKQRLHEIHCLDTQSEIAAEECERALEAWLARYA